MPIIDPDEALNAVRMFNRARHFYGIKVDSEINDALQKALLNNKDIPIEHPLLEKIKGAALKDIFKSPDNTLKGGPVTRSAIARNGLERGIERRDSLGIDKRKSGESSRKKRRSLISVFS